MQRRSDEEARRELSARVDALHRGRPRVWSLVITFFGDAVVPRGGEVWLGVVAELMEHLGVNPGTLGAAMSRLTAEGWLERSKVGRRSHYRLAESGRQTFDAAMLRVYGLDEASWTGQWSLHLTDRPDATAWASAGFGRLAPDVFVRPERGDAPPVPARSSESVFSPDPADAPAFAARAYPLDASETRHADFVGAFRGLTQALRSGRRLVGGDAMAARTLLVHAYRRVVLKDPVLPRAARLPGTSADEARRLVGELYQRLLAESEAWLDAQGEDGALRPPGPRFFERFGGLFP